MHAKRNAPSALSLAIILLTMLLGGCSGGGGGATSGGSAPVATQTVIATIEVPVPGPTVYITPTPLPPAPTPPVATPTPTPLPTPAEPHAKIVVSFPTPKSAGAAARQYRFVGYDGGDEVRYGPVTYPAAPAITLENVPVSVVGLVIESIDTSGAVEDTRHTATQLQQGDTKHIDDPSTSAASLDGLAVIPGRVSLARGTTVAFHLQGIFSDGITQDLTRTADWSCANPAIAQVRGSQGGLVGLVTGVSAGETDVHALYARRQVKGHVVVRDTTVTRLEVSPSTASLNVDTAVSLTVLAHLADGTVQDVTNDANWATNAPTVARVLSQPPNAGLVIGIKGGDAQITASFGGQSAISAVRVTGAALSSLVITPSLAKVSRGLTQQLTALGTYADGSTADLTSRVSWATSDGTVASVTSGGAASGLARGLAVGTVTVTARYGDQSASSTLEVTAAQVVSLGVSATRAAVVPGDTLQFTATASFTDATTQDVTGQALWRSGNSAVARMVGGTATGVSVGATSVSASFGGLSASAPITVVQGVPNQMSVSSPRWWVGVGETLPLLSSILLSSGAVQLLTDASTWSASDTAIATVSTPQGVLTGVSPGRVSVTATNGTYGSASASIRVIEDGEIISRDSAGQRSSNGWNTGGPVSADGRFVVFRSTAYNMVPGGFNGQSDIYVRDRLFDTLERVSVDSNGVEANAHCYDAAVSADGSVVAFTSDASNLGPGPVFVRNRSQGTTVSVGADGGNSMYLSISDDGRYVHLAGMRYDLRTSTHVQTPDTRASRLSGDGRFVVYEAGTPSQIYIADIDLGGTPELVSATPFATEGNNQSKLPNVSTDGRFVVFQSDASDLVAGDTNGYTDIFIRDRLVGVTERVSLSTSGAQGDRRSYGSNPYPAAWVSADGRYVTFSSLATNLDATDTSPDFVDVFVRDRTASTTRCLTSPYVDSSNPSVRFSTGDIFAMGASADGRFFTFDAYGWWSITHAYSDYQDVFLKRAF